MRLSTYAQSLSLLFLSGALAADSKAPKPCTVSSASRAVTYDLNPMAVLPPKPGKKTHKDDREESWHARGYDYGSNFTLNFCEPVIEELENVVGVDEKLWRNVSAYYTDRDRTYSIGQMSSGPVLRGRELILTYTNGSPCGPTGSKPSDDEDEPNRKAKSSVSKVEPSHRKSAVINLVCDRELTAKASVTFLWASEDECIYVFKSRSAAACGGVSQEQQAVGPAGVFGLIVLIAAAVYFVGGIAYQRTVMHQRGWGQLPNYAMWAGMASFVKDMFIILTSSCVRFLPSRKGYNQLPTQTRGRGSTRADDENRLIDQLDEEWDD